MVAHYNTDWFSLYTIIFVRMTPFQRDKWPKNSENQNKQILDAIEFPALWLETYCSLLDTEF